jgi:hypothetical protein
MAHQLNFFGSTFNTTIDSVAKLIYILPLHLLTCSYLIYLKTGF